MARSMPFNSLNPAPAPPIPSHSLTTHLNHGSAGRRCRSCWRVVRNNDSADKTMDRGRPEDHNLYVSLFVEKFGWKSDEAFMDGPTGTYRLRSQNEFLDNRDCGTTRQRGQPRPGRPAWSFSSQYVEQPDPWIPQQRPARPKSARRPSPGKRSEGTVPGCSTMRADAVRTPGSKHVVGATGCFELRDWVPVMRHGEDPREAAKV